MTRPAFRFAPSPTGELHIGHAYSALLGWRRAKEIGGRFLVRIEDIDTGRTREHFIAQIFEDLAWLGLDWEEPVLRQSTRFAEYAEQAGRLRELGVLCPCFATRSEIAAAIAGRPDHPRDPDGAPLYPGLAKGLGPAEAAARIAAGEPHAWRLDMARAVPLARAHAGCDQLSYGEVDLAGNMRTVTARPERWGDAVIVRKDTPASYHLACVIDDADQGITHVFRGCDIEPATDLHVVLQALLDLPAPRYHHHRLILGADGRKLSKSDGATSLRALRERGVTREEVLAMVGL